ncbi:MAG: alpha/beta hydrolase [Saprospiraceae bacterium]|nr:alpha/beta hydrolase [Saprospiraceae bacterium]
MKNTFSLIFLFFGILTFSACQKEKISLGTNIQDLFYLDNQGAKMPILVEGNMASGIIVLWIHGGPGGTAIGFQNDADITAFLEPKYTVAYWDQRAAGVSQGNTSQLGVSLYAEDLKKVIILLKSRYGADKKVFLLSHSWGGLIAPAFLTEGSNQGMVQGWINVAGAHNYIKNDSLTRDYLIQYGKEQVAKNINIARWQDIVDYAEAHVPDYTFKTSSGLNLCASTAEGLISDINPGGSITDIFQSKTAFSFFAAASNSGATYFSGLNDRIMYAEYSSKLSLIKLPLLCITGKYDFTVPRGLADEVMQKAASVKKKLVILPHSGHICMSQEPTTFYEAVIKFVEENK